jgi:hypothetical protein
MKSKVSAVSAIFLFFAFSAQAQEASSVPVDSIEPEQQQTAQPESASTEAGQVESEKFTELSGKVDGLNESYLETKGNVDKLSKIKVSGYIQAQFNYSDTMGVIAANVQDRFLIKRGRLKTSYETSLAKYVLEIDATQDGVGLKDAYVSFKEPWLKMFSATIGAMDRPFGYEVGYSSSMLESPERSKVIGVLFPKEKDIGAMLEIAADEGPLSYFNLKAGAYNGMTNILNENDDNKDAIGRLGFKLPFANAGLAIDGGVSVYAGKVTAMDTTGGKGTSYTVTNKVWNASTASQVHATYDRQYTGFDAQLYYATPVIGGTCVKGEYLFGKNPGTKSKYDPYGLATPSLTDNVFNREMSGYYVYLIQNIDPINGQLVFKYDQFDPNAQLDPDDLAASGGTSADVALGTAGFGAVYYLPWDPNVRLMLYYEMPKYEKIGILGITDKSLNLLTFRVQFKF